MARGRLAGVATGGDDCWGVKGKKKKKKKKKKEKKKKKKKKKRKETKAELSSFD